jgi:hypothetical protein
MKKIEEERLLKIFIILQPILDLITSYQSTYLNFDISFSIILRGLAFVFVIFYLLFFGDNKKVKKYMIIIVSFLTIFMANMLFTKGFTYIFKEAYTVVRFFYFPIMLLFFCVAYKKLKSAESFDKKMAMYVACFYFLIAALAFITGTSYLSYDDPNKIGFNGWFYSANERGSTYAILLPILFAYIFKDKKTIALILLGIFAMLILGTKVGYLGVILTLGSAFIYLLLRKFIFKDKNILYIAGVLSALMIVALLTTTLPVYKNIKYQTDSVDEIIKDKEDMTQEEIDNAIEQDDNYLIEDKEQNLVFSRREIYLEQNIKYFKEQAIMNKLFGSGSENKKLSGELIARKVERDFFDVFFTFGIVGFIVYFVPFIYILVNIAISVLKNIKKIITPSMWFNLTSIVIALAISFMSGHVLVSPSVSIFLVLIICETLKKSENSLFDEKKEL